MTGSTPRWRGPGAVFAELFERGRVVARYVVDRPVGALLAVALLFRVTVYLADRSLWLDEASLLGNIVGRTWSGLFAPMRATQIVPPGFLAIEVAVAQWLGTSTLALRLLPLIGGVVSAFGFVALTARIPARTRYAQVAALAVFAVSGDLVYFASELKPYSTDAAVAVGLMLLGLSARDGGRRPLVGLAAAGALAVWVSFPAAFVLGAVGLALLGDAARRRDAGRVLILGGVGLCWLSSFAGSYALARRLLGDAGSDGMQAFWRFAFPPWPPSTAADLAWPIRRFVFLFANPLDFYSRLMPGLNPWLAAAAAGLALIGGLSIARRSPFALAILIGPLALALLAAYGRRYPFHGRLLVFAAPALIALLGAGADALAGGSRSRAARVGLVALMVAGPLGRSAFRWVQDGWDRSHNAVGDLRAFGVEGTARRPPAPPRVTSPN